MKKIITLTTVMAFALSFGLAYAADYSKAMSEDIGNGVTVFERGSAVFDIGPTLSLKENDEEGAAAGGMDRESEVSAYNGVTVLEGPAVFDIGPTEALVSGAAAGGLSREEASMEWHNGITIFKDGPAVYDIGPTE